MSHLCPTCGARRCEFCGATDHNPLYDPTKPCICGLLHEPACLLDADARFERVIHLEEMEELFEVFMEEGFGNDPALP